MSAEIFDIVKFERTAEQLAKSKYSPERNIHDALWLIATGASLGIDPATSMRSIHIVKGRPVLSADLMAAVAMNHPACDYLMVKEMTAERCVIVTKRKGWPDALEMTWTLEDAKRAGLNGDNWRKYPQSMLKARCMAQLVRAAYPDALAGVYVEGELFQSESQSSPDEFQSSPDEVLHAEIIDAPIEPIQELTTRDKLKRLVLETVGRDEAKDFLSLLPSLYGVETAQELPESKLEALLTKMEQMNTEERQDRIRGALLERAEPGDWAKSNRHYRALMGEAPLEKHEREEFEAYIEAQYAVDSWKKLRSSQIEEWIELIKCGGDVEARAQMVRELLFSPLGARSA